jgi:hypothetical protein
MSWIFLVEQCNWRESHAYCKANYTARPRVWILLYHSLWYQYITCDFSLHVTCRLMSDVRCRRAVRAHEAGPLPSKRTRCIYATSPSSGRTSGAKPHSSRTQASTRAPEDTFHALALLHTDMANTQGQSYATARRCKIHVRPSSHNFTAPAARQEKDGGRISQRSFTSTLDLPINTIQTLTGNKNLN